MKKHFKKTYAFLAAGLLALATGVGIYNAGPSVEPVKAEDSVTTIDFSTMGYSNAQSLDGELIEEGSVSLVFEKNTGSTAPSYYNTGTAARLYAGNKLTINSAGALMTNLEFTIHTGSDHEYVSGMTINSSSGDAVAGSGDSNVITSELGTDEITITNPNKKGHMRIQKINITTVSAELEPIATISGETNGLSGDSLTLSASTRNFTGTEFTYAWSVAEDDAELVSLTNETTSEVTVNLLKEGTATINLTVTSGEESASATFDINILGVLSVKEAKETIDVGNTAYVRGIVFAEYGASVYIADEDGTGMQLYSYDDLGVNVGEEVVVTGTMATYNNGLQLSNPEILSHEATSKTVAPIKVTYDELNDDLCNSLISLENMVYHSGTSTSQNIYFYENGDSSKQYVLYNNKTSSSYRTELAAAMKDWQEDVTTVTLVGPHIRFNSTLEMNLTSATTYEVDKVDTFARSFIANLTCDPTGQTAPSVEEWNTLAEEFALLSEEEKALFKQETSDNELINAVTEKYDYILGKYTDETYTNFMERTITPSPVNSGLAPVFNQTNNIIIIVSVCVLAISAIGVFIVISKKRKEIKK